MQVFIRLTAAGANTGPLFDIWADSPVEWTIIAVNVPKATLLVGAYYTVDDNTEHIKITNVGGICEDLLLTVVVCTTTTTTTSGPTTTTTSTTSAPTTTTTSTTGEPGTTTTTTTIEDTTTTTTTEEPLDYKYNVTTYLCIDCDVYLGTILIVSNVPLTVGKYYYDMGEAQVIYIDEFVSMDTGGLDYGSEFDTCVDACASIVPTTTTTTLPV